MTGEYEHTGIGKTSASDMDFAPDRLRDAPEPSPIPGMDMNTFRNFLIRAIEGDQTVPPTILNQVNAAMRGNDKNERDKRDQSGWERLFWQLALNSSLQAINGLIDQYNQMADWHHDQAEKARARMNEAAEKLHAIDDFVRGADDLFADKDQTGAFDREKAIRLLKSRGVEVDPNEDWQSLANKLLEEKKKAMSERKQWSDVYDQAQADAAAHDAAEAEARRKAQELVERREAIRRGGYDPAVETIKLREITEQYKPDVQRKAVEIEKQKVDIGKAEELRASLQSSLDNSQSSQTKSEVSDFEALAEALTGKFEVAANLPKETPEVSPLNRLAPPASSPVSSV